jgi:hypothetical protein
MTVGGQSPVSYSSDNANRLTQITQGSTNVRIAPDSDGRRKSVALPNGVSLNHLYYPDSQVKSITYKLGSTTLGDLSYGYDLAGRRTSVGGSFARTGTPQAAPPATYNVNNQLTSTNYFKNYNVDFKDLLHPKIQDDPAALLVELGGEGEAGEGGCGVVIGRKGAQEQFLFVGKEAGPFVRDYILDSTSSFCYPFFVFDSRSISAMWRFRILCPFGVNKCFMASSVVMSLGCFASFFFFFMGAFYVL